MSNPIYTSELLKDDGELSKILSQLKELRQEYESMIGSIKSNAETLEAPLKKVNVSTSSQRENLKQVADQVEKLEQEYQKYASLLDENAVKVAAVKEAQKQLNNVNKLEAKIATAKNGSLDQLNAKLKLNKVRLSQMTEAEKEQTKEGKKLVDQTTRLQVRIKALSDEQREATKLKILQVKADNAEKGSKEQLSAQLSINIIKLSKLSQEERENTDAGKALTKETLKLNEKLKDIEKTYGNNTRNVGNYKSVLEGMPGVLGRVSGGASALGGVFKKLLANPIVALFAGVAAVLGTLFGAFKQTEQGAQLFNKVGGFIKGVWTEVISIAGIAAEIIGHVLSGEFGKAKDSAIEFGKALVDLPENAKKTGDAMAELDNRIRENVKVTRGLTKEIAELNAQQEIQQAIADDATRSFKEQEDAAERVRQIIEKKSAKEIQLAKMKQAEVAKQIEIEKAAGKNIEELLDKKLEADLQLLDAENNYTLAVMQNEKERAQLKQDRLERDLDILIDGYDNQMKINRDLIKDETKTFEERRALLEKTVQLGQDSFDKQIETIQKFTGIQVDANDLINESDAVALNQKIRNYGLSEIIEGRLLEIIRDRKDANFDLAESEKELNAAEKKANEERLKRIKDLDAAIKDQNKERIEKEKEQRQLQFDQQQEFAKSQFDLLNSSEREKTLFALNQQQERIRNELKYNDTLTEIQKATYRNQIALIEKQKADVDKITNEDGAKDIYDLFGFNISDERKAIINDSVEQVKQIVLDFAATKTKLAEQAVQDSANEVQSAENALQTQIELANQGHAADIDGAKRDLKLAKDTQDKALKQRQEAQRQEILLQSALQAANLVTASTNVYKQFGFPASLPILALMWGSFIASKARAIQLTKEKRSEGGLDFIGGGSHASGNDTFLNYYQNGRPVYAERGESHMVLKPRPTKRYKKILPSLFHALNNERLDLFLNASNSVSDPIINVDSGETWLRKIYNQGQTKTYNDERGNLVEINGTRKTIYVS